MSEADDYMHHKWALVDHVCAACYGRVLARPIGGERYVFRCSNCGVEREGQDVAIVCACSLPGVECQPNTDITPEWPGLYVAVKVGAD